MVCFDYILCFINKIFKHADGALAALPHQASRDAGRMAADFYYFCSTLGIAGRGSSCGLALIRWPRDRFLGYVSSAQNLAEICYEASQKGEPTRGDLLPINQNKKSAAILLASGGRGRWPVGAGRICVFKIPLFIRQRVAFLYLYP